MKTEQCMRWLAPDHDESPFCDTNFVLGNHKRD